MRYVMKIGPVEFDNGSSTTYLALGDDGLFTVFADSDEAGLKQLLLRSREVAVCEPALRKAAGKLGLRVERPPPEALALKAGLAVSLAHGTMLKVDNLELIMELAEAMAAFVRAEPWTVFEGDEALTIELKNPTRTYESCVMGQNGEVFGLAMYHQPGSIQRVNELADAGHDEEQMMLPCTSIIVDEEPAFAVEAMKEFTGLAISPGLIHIQHGEPAPMKDADVAGAVAALKAVVSLSMGESGLGKAESSRSRVSARVSRPGARPEQPTAIPYAGTARNDLCPCGSGNKYKRCHLGSEAPTGPGQSWHERDHRLIETLLKFSTGRFAPETIKRMGPETFGSREVPIGLVGPLATYEWPVEGKSVAAHFLERPGTLIDAADRQWLDAQVAAQLGVWEVLRVDRGAGLELVNLLTGARRFVSEMKGSQTLVARDAMLARVVDAPGMSLLGGNHLAPLGPREADDVVRRAKAEAIEPGWKLTVRLLELWDEAVSERALRLASPMRVRNTDGHAAVMLEDEFALKKGSFPSALSRLSALEGASLGGQDGRGAHLTFTRPGNPIHSTWKNTIIGSVRLTKTKLTASTNSVERADALKQRLSDALVEIATFRKRTEEPLPPMRGGADLMIDGQAVSSPSTTEMYRGWLDTETPLLGGRTPRAAVSDSAARPTIHQLLKEMENTAARAPEPHEGYDTRQLRRELGLDELGAPVANQDLDRAVGNGRKISETLLDFARPLFNEQPATERDFEAALRFATLVWNLVVAEERQWDAKAVAKLRSALAPRKFSLELMRHHDMLITRKRERFAGDLRMVGKWQLHRSARGVGVEMEALLSPELIAQLTPAALRPK